SCLPSARAWGLSAGTDPVARSEVGRRVERDHTGALRGLPLVCAGMVRLLSYVSRVEHLPPTLGRYCMRGMRSCVERKKVARWTASYANGSRPARRAGRPPDLG